MRRARDIDAYVADPIGRYVAGPTFLHFFTDPALCGIVFWGRPDEHAIRALTRALDVELPDRCGPHATYVDARRLTGVDEAAFQALAGYVGPRAEVFGEMVTHPAIVRPEGVVGAMVAGFYDVTRSVNPERRRVFDNPEDAFRWMGRASRSQLVRRTVLAIRCRRRPTSSPAPSSSAIPCASVRVETTKRLSTRAAALAAARVIAAARPDVRTTIVEREGMKEAHQLGIWLSLDGVPETTRRRSFRAELRVSFARTRSAMVMLSTLTQCEG